MVRVAGLHDKVEAKTEPARRRAGARGHARADPARALEQRERLTRCFEDELRPALAEHGIRILTLSAATPAEREQVEHLFASQVFPVLTPAGDRPRPAVPVHLEPLAQPRRAAPRPREGGGGPARVKVPKELLRRFLAIGDAA